MQSFTPILNFRPLLILSVLLDPESHMSPGQFVQWLEHWPEHERVLGLILGQGHVPVLQV